MNDANRDAWPAKRFDAYEVEIVVRGPKSPAQVWAKLELDGKAVRSKSEFIKDILYDAFIKAVKEGDI